MLMGGIDATSAAYELIRQEFRGPNVDWSPQTCFSPATVPAVVNERFIVTR